MIQLYYPKTIIFFMSTFYLYNKSLLLWIWHSTLFEIWNNNKRDRLNSSNMLSWTINANIVFATIFDSVNKYSSHTSSCAHAAVYHLSTTASQTDVSLISIFYLYGVYVCVIRCVSCIDYSPIGHVHFAVSFHWPKHYIHSFNGFLFENSFNH